MTAMDLKPLIIQVANLYNLRIDILTAQVQIESGGDPFALRYEDGYFEKYIRNNPKAKGYKYGPFAACSIGLLQILYETGVPGFVLFSAFIIYILKTRQVTDRLVFVVFLVEGCFGFPLYTPTTAALAAFVAGHLCACRADVRDSLAQGRLLFWTWVEKRRVLPPSVRILPSG